MIRTCVACGQSDDHPKDQVIIPPEMASVFHHHDCGAAMDPACPGCSWLVQHKGSLKGSDWREHVIELHDGLSDEQRALQPHERDTVKSHLNGKRGK